MTYLAPTQSATAEDAGPLQRYLRIIFALMMHDIKNRFFGSGLGQIVMIIWPFVHIVVLLVIYIATNKPHPYGDSLLQFSSVSLYPFICFNYVSRWVCYSAAQNKTFLQYPIIRPLDIVVARSLLEIVSITIVGVCLVLTLIIAGDNVIPYDPIQAMSATCATLFLAIGFGFLNAAFAFIIPLWVMVMTLFIILIYISSGIVFIPTALPEPIRTYLSYNPLLNCIEWMRSAYFDDYPTQMVDRIYVLSFSLVCLTAGLVLIKALRRFY